MNAQEPIVKELSRELRSLRLDEKIRIMEVCGTHTMQFFHTGVKDLFPPGLELIDGPGCPVCVTPNHYLDRAVAIARSHRVILCTFGDMMRVPSSFGSLQKEKAAGVDVRIVYSPLDALDTARQNPDREVVFLSVGFETTIPTEAVCVEMAGAQDIKNFSILAGNKLTPPAVAALLDAGETTIDGFILPGHVSAVTGAAAWRFLPGKYDKPCVVTGFNAKDLLLGTLTLVKLIQSGRADLVNVYPEVVAEGGNPRAAEVIERVFAVGDADWRGIGVIPGSGMVLRDEYRDFDAVHKFPVTLPEAKQTPGCRCGEILRGLALPPECPLFAERCTPEHAVGACMVSSEGSCAAYYKYGR